ncbi:alpha/beta hydrolase family protein [Bacteroides sp. 51]|uniref:alpha/beta hydrolase n=1 Tax=Bacteroides sp. 51 TaxID=2302938 RepID=UPI0013D13454|nr:alpha/beta hydrolase family protein [Bacteroides sp. 51]NDV83472.1 esterase family protein [Bacteroides sp. 51]
MRKLLLVLTFALPLSAFAAKVDTVMVKSPSMNKEVQVVIVTPDRALGATATSCPVIYLLHGYSGNARSWIELKPQLSQIADEKGIIFVCPDGKNSWYWDSPKNPSYRYETFVAKELVNYMDRNYKTIASRKGRAITGLSMGGHGAMWLSIRNKDTFGAAGSMSGGLDIRPFPKNWEMSKQLGEKASNEDLWNQYTVINQLDKIQNDDLAIIIDCGLGDFFLQVNKDMHDALVSRKINHDFILRPGVHNGVYWSNAVDYQILFFSKFFKR